MAMVTGEFKEFLTIKIKSRDDNIFDQYSRIFMVKILLIASMVCGISWYGDKFNCIVPGKRFKGNLKTPLIICIF